MAGTNPIPNSENLFGHYFLVAEESILYLHVQDAIISHADLERCQQELTKRYMGFNPKKAAVGLSGVWWEIQTLTIKRPMYEVNLGSNPTLKVPGCWEVICPSQAVLDRVLKDRGWSINGEQWRLAEPFTVRGLTIYPKDFDYIKVK